MTEYEDYQRRLKLAGLMIERAPNAMIRELNKKGIRENMTSEYFRLSNDKLSKYRLNYKDEADFKETLVRSLQGIENSFMHIKNSRRR